MIYFLDGNQEVIKIVRSEAVISAIQTQELPEDNSLLRDYLSVHLKNDERLFNAQYMAIKTHSGNRNAFDLYRIAGELVPDNATEFMGVQVAPYELEGVVIEDLRPQDRPLNQTMNQVLEGSDWRLGYVADNLPNVTTNFYYMSVKDALKKIQELTNVEMLFKVEISGNKITDKWVEVYHQLGNRTMKRFNYGTNALSVVRESSHDELYTALIGRGKGEEVGETESGDATYGRKINFADVEWKKSAGNPVDKPKGQKYIELPQATTEHGIKLIDGRKIPRIGIVDFSETDDPNVLISQTYQELLVRARPKVLFKASVINTGDMIIGDTVTIHRHDLDFHYQARVRKVVRDRKNNNKTQVEIGDVVHTPSTKRQSNINSALNNVASDLENVRGEVTEARQSADGKNTNFYGNVEPDRKKVGDTWFRDHPSLTGESQILVWNGEAWELTMDTSETTKNADAIAEQQQDIDDAKAAADEAVDSINTAVTNAGFTSLDETISSVQSISNSAQSNAQTAINNSIDALGDASTALTNAQTALNKADSVSGDISDINVEIDDINSSLSLKADSSLVDTISQTVNNHSLAIDANAQGLSLKANTTTVNALTGRVTTAETGISANATAIGLKASQSSVDTLTGTVNTLSGRVDVTAGQISSKVWNTDIQTAIDEIEVGGRNYLRNSDLSLGSEFWSGDGSLVDGGLLLEGTSGVSSMVHNMTVVPEGEYTLQVWYEVLEGEAPYLYNPLGGDAQITDIYPFKVDKEYFEVGITIGTSNSVPTFRYGGASPANHLVGKTLIKRVKLEKGNEATDWTLALEDTTALIKHVESELTQKHDSITATVSSIDGRVATNKLNLDGLTSTVQSVRTDLTGTTTLLNTTRTTVSEHTSTIATLRTDVNGKATTAQFNTLNSTVNGTITRVGNAEGRLTTIETNVNGLQTTVASKASQSQVTQLANGLQSVVKDLDDLEVSGRNLIPAFTSVRWSHSAQTEVEDYNIYFPAGHTGQSIIFIDVERETNYTFTFNSDYSRYVITEVLDDGTLGGRIIAHTGSEIHTFNTGNVNNIRVYIDTFSGNNHEEKNIWNLKLEKGNKATDWTPAPEDMATQSQISQLSDNINLRVTKGELLSQINIEAERTLIQSNRLLLNANNTVITGTAWMDGAVIANASIDTAQIADLAVSSAKIASLDVGKISGDISNFVATGWNSHTGGSVQATGDGIVTTASNGSQGLVQNGVFLVRNTTGSTVGHIGYNPIDHVALTISTSLGSHFRIVNHTGGGTYNTLMTLENGGVTGRFYPEQMIFHGRSVDLTGGNLLGVNQIIFQNSSSIVRSLSGDRRLTLNGADSWGLNARDTTIMAGSNNGTTSYLSVFADLNMNGYTVTNTSDYRLKEFISDVEIDSLDSIRSWEFKGFNWKDENLNRQVGRQMGLIAQNTPELAMYDSESDIWSINSSKQIMMNSHAIQQLYFEFDERVESNESKIHKLQQELSKANRRIEELEGAM